MALDRSRVATSDDDAAVEVVIDRLVSASFSRAADAAEHAALLSEAERLAEARSDVAALLRTLVEQVSDHRGEGAPAPVLRSHGWWKSQPWFALDPQTFDLLNGVDAPIEDCSAMCQAWSALLGVEADPLAEPTWQSMLVGTVVNVDLPRLDDLLRRYVGVFRRRGFLPPHHRTTLIRRPDPLASSYVSPGRLPGRTFLVLSDTVWASALEYVAHELSHVAHHAEIDGAAPLRTRWALDPVLSEGWALLWETVVRDPDLLAAELGVSETDAALLVTNFNYCERLNVNLFQAQVSFDASLCADPSVDPVSLAATIEAELGLQWGPEELLRDRDRTLQWRSYLAGYAFRDRFVAEATRQSGSRWRYSEELWARCRNALRQTRTAPTFLEAVFNA